MPQFDERAPAFAQPQRPTPAVKTQRKRGINKHGSARSVGKIQKTVLLNYRLIRSSLRSIVQHQYLVFLVSTGEALGIPHRYLREIAQYIATLRVELTRLEIHHAPAFIQAASEQGLQKSATGLGPAAAMKSKEAAGMRLWMGAVGSNDAFKRDEPLTVCPGGGRCW